MRDKLKKTAVFVLWIGVWFLISALIGNPLLLPSPLDTAKAMLRLAQTGELWTASLHTLLRIDIGYIAAILFGVLLGILCFFFRPVDLILQPICRLIRTTPVISFIILILLWIKTDRVPVFVSFLMVMPVIWTGVQNGLKTTDRKLIEMGRAFHLEEKEMLRKIYLPSAIPGFLTSCVNGLGLAWKAGISAEVIARPVRAIGTNLQDAKVYLETPELFAWTVVVIILSITIEMSLKSFSKWIMKRSKR